MQGISPKTLCQTKQGSRAETNESIDLIAARIEHGHPPELRIDSLDTLSESFAADVIMAIAIYEERYAEAGSVQVEYTSQAQGEQIDLLAVYLTLRDTLGSQTVAEIVDPKLETIDLTGVKPADLELIREPLSQSIALRLGSCNLLLPANFTMEHRPGTGLNGDQSRECLPACFITGLIDAHRNINDLLRELETQFRAEPRKLYAYIRQLVAYAHQFEKSWLGELRSFVLTHPDCQTFAMAAVFLPAERSFEDQYLQMIGTPLVELNEFVKEIGPATGDPYEAVSEFRMPDSADSDAFHTFLRKVQYLKGELESVFADLIASVNEPQIRETFVAFSAALDEKLSNLLGGAGHPIERELISKSIPAFALILQQLQRSRASDQNIALLTSLLQPVQMCAHAMAQALHSFVSEVLVKHDLSGQIANAKAAIAATAALRVTEYPHQQSYLLRAVKEEWKLDEPVDPLSFSVTDDILTKFKSLLKSEITFARIANDVAEKLFPADENSIASVSRELAEQNIFVNSTTCYSSDLAGHPASATRSFKIAIWNAMAQAAKVNAPSPYLLRAGEGESLVWLVGSLFYRGSTGSHWSYLRDAPANELVVLNPADLERISADIKNLPNQLLDWLSRNCSHDRTLQLEITKEIERRYCAEVPKLLTLQGVELATKLLDMLGYQDRDKVLDSISEEWLSLSAEQQQTVSDCLTQAGCPRQLVEYKLLLTHSDGRFVPLTGAKLAERMAFFRFKEILTPPISGEEVLEFIEELHHHWNSLSTIQKQEYARVVIYERSAFEFLFQVPPLHQAIFLRQFIANGSWAILTESQRIWAARSVFGDAIRNSGGLDKPARVLAKLNSADLALIFNGFHYTDDRSLNAVVLLATTLELLPSQQRRELSELLDFSRIRIGNGRLSTSILNRLWFPDDPKLYELGLQVAANQFRERATSLNSSYWSQTRGANHHLSFVFGPLLQAYAEEAARRDIGDFPYSGGLLQVLKGDFTGDPVEIEKLVRLILVSFEHLFINSSEQVRAQLKLVAKEMLRNERTVTALTKKLPPSPGSRLCSDLLDFLSQIANYDTKRPAWFNPGRWFQ